MSLLSDRELVERYFEGDEDAFLTLISRYYGLMRYCCAKIFENKDVVEDLIQESILRILVEINRFDPNRRDANFKNWALTITHHIALNYKKRMSVEHRIKNTLNETNIETPEKHNPIRSLSATEAYKVLLAAVDMLREPTRTYIVEFYFHGLPIDDIGKAHTVKKWQVKHQLHKGLKSLRKGLGGLLE